MGAAEDDIIAARFVMEGAAVQRIYMPYLFDTVMRLEGLSQLAPGPRSSIIFPMFVADQALDELLNRSFFSSSIRSSRVAGDQLTARLHFQLQSHQMTEVVDEFAIAGITTAYQTFKAAFLAEVGVFPSYFVTQKAGFDTHTLLMNGEAIFPAHLVTKVPEAKLDVQEAARALAFELPTACGFHTFRIVESVLRRYYTALSGDAEIPEDKRSLGGVLHLMKQGKIGDPNVISALQQIKDLHRNPLAHPDVSIELEEAISIIGMSQSVITFMLQKIPAPESEMAQSFASPQKAAHIQAAPV
ncbi:hypothetical protein [Brucella sp. IR073]|uniref:hypothetical protein n=1 Tax=unclassified Brucella TaxID=2632610 RepID=UPI003B984918